MIFINKLHPKKIIMPAKKISKAKPTARQITLRRPCPEFLFHQHPLSIIEAFLDHSEGIWDKDGRTHNAINKDTGEINAIEDDSTNFKMVQWVVPENEVPAVAEMIAKSESGFTRQD